MQESGSNAAPSARRRVLRTLVTLAGVALVLTVAQQARAALGIEWSAESLRETVKGYGVWAPLTYLALVCVRQFLALPSMLILTAAGLLFGAALGTLLGGLGIAMNACMLFGTARLMGRQWVLPRLHARWPSFETRARSAGPPFIALMTGHPTGVLTPFHFAAGITAISWPVFLLAVGPAAVVRAGCYSLLGANLLDVGSPGFWVASVAIGVLALAPMAHPGLRRRLLGAPPAQ
ncbi:MAG: TVP38/TMEM64 family protein [Myxococcales bacterium]|nr:TVP38/TMEM64 family protein [Myxococcales bacterium]